MERLAPNEQKGGPSALQICACRPELSHCSLREKVWFARVSFRGFPQLLSTCACFSCLVCFWFLVSCNLEVLNCGGVAFDLMSSILCVTPIRASTLFTNKLKPHRVEVDLLSPVCVPFVMPSL